LAQWLRLCEQPWFSRNWVLQEATVASVTQVIIGDEEVGGMDFLKIAFFWLIRHEFDEVRNSPQDFQVHDQTDRPDHPESDRAFETIELVKTWKTISHSHAKQRAELLDLLQRCRRFHATDPRDRIYALLGLCADAAGAPRPDYAMTTAEVYLQYARYFVARGQGPKLREQEGRQRSSMDIPSWVPDWTTNLTEGIDFDNYKCNASGDMLAESAAREFGVSDDAPRTLLVAAVQIDKIVDVGPPFPQHAQSETLGTKSMQACRDWHAESCDLFQNSTSTRYQSMAERRAAFSHLVLLQPQYNPAEEGSPYFRQLESLRNPRAEPPGADAVARGHSTVYAAEGNASDSVFGPEFSLSSSVLVLECRRPFITQLTRYLTRSRVTPSPRCQLELLTT
jgi:hypothetical protein